MKVRVLRDFRNRTENLKLRKVGEELTVTRERCEKLEGLGLVERIRDSGKKKA